MTEDIYGFESKDYLNYEKEVFGGTLYITYDNLNNNYRGTFYSEDTGQKYFHVSNGEFEEVAKEMIKKYSEYLEYQKMLNDKLLGLGE